MRVSSADRLMHILCCRSVMHESARRPFVRPLTACRSAAMATAPSVPAKAFPAGSLANEPDRSRRGTGPISARGLCAGAPADIGLNHPAASTNASALPVAQTASDETRATRPGASAPFGALLPICWGYDAFTLLIRTQPAPHQRTDGSARRRCGVRSFATRASEGARTACRASCPARVPGAPGGGGERLDRLA